MNTHRDPDRLIHAFLLEGDEQLQDRVYDVVRAEIEHKRQRAFFRPWRTTPMTSYLRIAAVIATVAVAGFASIYAFGPGPNVGSGPTSHPPTAVSPGSPAPTTSGCTDFQGGGTYSAPAGPLSLTVMVPDAGGDPWLGHPDYFDMLRADCDASQGLGWLEAKQVTQLYPDACQWGSAGVDVDSVAATIAAFSNVPGIEVGELTDVTVDGYAGSRFDVSVPAEFDASACTDGMLKPVDGVSGVGPDNVHTVSLIDVQGILLAITIHEYALQPPDVAAQLDAIIESMQIEP